VSEAHGIMRVGQFSDRREYEQRAERSGEKARHSQSP
jgi:hypothetical protein